MMHPDAVWNAPYVPTLADRARAALDGLTVVQELLTEYVALQDERDRLEARLQADCRE